MPPGYDANLIDVKYRAGTDVFNPIMLLPQDLQGSVERIGPLAPMGGEKFRWLRIWLKPSTDESEFMRRLRLLEWVEIAEFGALPSPLP